MDKLQKEMVKKTKVKMWAGLVFIVAAGLTIAIYFIFLKDTSETEKSASWKTYTNEIMGYQFQYPDNMEVVIDEPKREVDLKGPALESGLRWPRFYIANYPGDEYRPTEEDIDLKSWVTEQFGFEEFATDREIAGFNAVHIDTITNSNDDYLDRYLFLKQGQIYQVDILHVDGRQDWEIYNKFLDSITFDIEEEVTEDENFTSVSTSDWLTYTDEVNNYSVKYPADYEVAQEEDGYVVFDSTLVESADLSYLHFVVETRDTDLYTFQTSILTNDQVGGDFEPLIEDIVIDGLKGKQITLKNELGETIIHNLVNYLGKTYDIFAGDSLSDVLSAAVDNFSIEQFDDDVDITDTSLFDGKECISHSDCGAYPCNPANNKCLIKDCLDDTECTVGVCGLHATPVPGFCTTIDVL